MENLEKFVGTFAKIAYQYENGKIVYGMVDAVHRDRLGFVFANDVRWVGTLIKDTDLQELSEDEVELALESARKYWQYEVESLKARIEKEYDIDDPKQLQKMLANAKEWVKRLG